jgi:hypothetical protein
MKISFDGLRKNIAADFNALAEDVQDLESFLDRGTGFADGINKLRSSLGALMACYDSEQMPDDFNDLSEEVELFEL